MAASVGMSAASAAGAFSPDLPDAPDYSKVTRDALEAEIDLAPDRLRLAKSQSPEYAALQRRLAYENLFGTGGAPGSIELARQATPELAEMLRVARGIERAGEVEDLQRYGPAMREALERYDPALAALSNRLVAEAQEGVDAGYGLTPAERLAYQQDVRASQAARGVGRGPGDVYLEALRLNAGRTAVRDRRLEQASRLLGQRASLYGDPMQAILGRASGRAADPSGYVGAAMGSPIYQPNINPAYGIAGQQYATESNAAMGQYNQQMNALSGLSSGMGSLGGSFLGASLTDRLMSKYPGLYGPRV